MTCIHRGHTIMTCSGCYHGFSGWWCDNCDTWPCTCNDEDTE